MFVDLHAHTSAISHCCRADAEQIMATAKEYGFDGLVITNHYTRSYYPPDGFEEWIEKYIAEWHNCRSLGKKMGLKIFCGAEITMEYEPRLHMLIYGADEKLLRENPRLCDLTLEQLYNICRKNDCALVQAHPFRGGATVQNTDFLDGVEINCHPFYGNSFAAEVEKAAKKANLALTVGCDYHADVNRVRGGVFLPESIKTDKDLADFILNSKEFSLQIEEPADGAFYKKEYRR